MGKEHLPLRREPNAAGRPREEPRPELVLEALDLPAERRLRDVEAARCTTDVALLRHSDKVVDLREAHRLTLPRRARAPPYPNGIGRARAPAVTLASMSITLFGPREKIALRRAGQAAAATLSHVAAHLAPGVTTADIDRWVREDTLRRGGTPSQLGYHGFPAAVCTSRNQVVCHGIPRRDERLSPGDIVNVDVTTSLGGFHGDTSATFFIGDPSPEARHVVDVARRCRDAGISVVREGARLGDIGAAIEELALREGCSVVRDFCGHGIGRVMHAPPQVSHYGVRGTGLRLKAGMVFTIEPMVNLGGAEVRILADGWTVVTADGSLSAQFEHTVLVTRDGVEVLTG